MILIYSILTKLSLLIGDRLQMHSYEHMRTIHKPDVRQYVWSYLLKYLPWQIYCN